MSDTSPSRPDPNEQFRNALSRLDGHAALRRADAVLCRFGSNVDEATNPSSASNDVWLVDDLCLRMSRQPGPDSIATGVRLAAILPAAVGYPEVLASGVEDGHEWMLMRRLPGLNLWDAWLPLSPEQRLTAVADLWQRHVALHQTAAESLAGLSLPLPRRFRSERSEADSQLHRLVAATVLDAELAAPLWNLIERGLDAMQAVPWGLIHGDPGLTNAQCYAGRVIGLLDLEAAGLGPIDHDLSVLLRILADPLNDPGSPGPHGLPDQASFTGAFDALVAAGAPVIGLPGASDRLRGSAVLFDLTILDNALSRGVPAEELRQWTRHIVDVASHRSYLDDILT